MNNLDPKAVALAKAIRETESKGDFNAKGASGEWGAYQFMPNTWVQYSKEVGVNAPFGAATPDQQNEVAYKKIKQWKDQGYNPGQIASMWNAGAGKPNAYLEGNKGVNSQGVAYDTQAYAQKVARAYQNIKNQSIVQGTDQKAEAYVPEEPKNLLQRAGGAIGNFAKEITRPVATMIARPFQLGMASVGRTEEQQANVPILSKIYGDIDPSKNVSDVVKDVGRGLQTVLFGIGGGAAATTAKGLGKAGVLQSALTATKGGAASGAVGGLGYGLEQGGTDSSLGSLAAHTAGGAALGGIAGGLLGGVGGLAGAAQARVLPTQSQTVFRKVKDLDNLKASYPAINKAFSNVKNKDFIDDALINTDLLVGSVNKKGKIDAQRAIQKVMETRSPYEDMVMQTAVKEGKTVNIRDVEKKIMKKIQNGDLQLGGIPAAMSEAKRDLRGLLLKADKDGNIPLSEIQASKIYKYQNLDYTKPETKLAGKTIAEAFKEIVEDNIDAIDVRNVNKKLGELYELEDVLGTLNGKGVEGSRLGRYFSQTLGGLIGSHFGPLGTVAGAETAAGLRGLQMAGAFGKSLGKDLEPDQFLKESLEKAGQATKKVRVPVQSQASEFTDELPVIQMGGKGLIKKLTYR